MTKTANFDFTDQRVFITGGSNGIGLAIAQAFHVAGAGVTITGTKDAATDYPADLGAFDYHQLDMGDGDKIKALVGGQKKIDILINCAGTALGADGISRRRLGSYS